MAYSGMAAAEFDDIQRLNAAYLELARRRTGTRAGLPDTLPPALDNAWRSGTVAAAVAAEPIPYLLFCIAIEPQRPATEPLFDAVGEGIDLATLALAFMQRLGRREAFCLRVATGLTDDEHRLLVGTGVAEFGKLARSAPEPIVPALAATGFFWPGLVAAVESRDTGRLRTLLALGHHHLLRRAGLVESGLRRAARAVPAGRRVADVR